MLYELALHFRSLQLYAHCAHNTGSGPHFFADHAFLGELYGAYESAYDAIVERMIGLGEEFDIFKLQQAAGTLIGSMEFKSDEAAFRYLKNGEDVVCQIVEKCFEEVEYSQGTLNLLAQFADDSESRIYKLQQRLK